MILKLMVVDGNSIINRSFYGIRPLTTREGLYTNAVYGFITTLQRLLDEEQPEAVCVTFDRREPTFRHEADASYKATRHGMPEELAMQMPVLKQLWQERQIEHQAMLSARLDAQDARSSLLKMLNDDTLRTLGDTIGGVSTSEIFAMIRQELTSVQ